MRKRLHAGQIWAAPAVLGALSAFGLTAALFSESVGDVLAWLALAVPVAVVAWCSRRRQTGGAWTP